jgi:hypothetical protein
MRRTILLVTVAVVMAGTTVPAGVVFAQPPSDIERGNPSCFGAFARSEPGPPPGPGDFVSEAATTLAESVNPGSGTDEVARHVGLVQHVRQDVCPADGPLQQQEEG